MIFCKNNYLEKDFVSKWFSVADILCRNKVLVSISIGVNQLAAIVYVKERKEEGVELFYQTKLPEAAWDYAWLEKPNLIKGALQDLSLKLELEELEMERLGFVICLEEYCFSEDLELPELQVKDLEEALLWELSEHVPWLTGTYTYRYKINKSNKLTEGQKSDDNEDLNQLVQIYAVENICLDTICRLCEELNWSLLLVTMAEALPLLEEEQITNIDFYEAHFTQEKLKELVELYEIPIRGARLYFSRDNSINFLSKQERNKALLKDAVGGLKLCTYFFALCSLFMGVTASAFNYWDMKNLNGIEAKVKRYAQWEGYIKETQALEQQRLKLEQEIGKIESKKLYWSKYLRELGRALPKGVWLTKISQQKEQERNLKRKVLVLKGKAESSELISRLKGNLEHTAIFKNAVVLNTSNQIKDSDFTEIEGFLNFYMTVEIKDNLDSKEVKV